MIIHSNRSTVVTAVVTAVLTAVLVTGIQAALASGTGEARAVAGPDFYYATKTFSCPLGGADCSMSSLLVRCDAGDEAIGGIGYARDVSSGDFRGLSVLNGMDRPHKARGWKILDADGVVPDGWEYQVRVYCANTG